MCASSSEGLALRGVYKWLDELERKLYREITKPCATDLTLTGMIETINTIEQTVKDAYQGSILSS